MSATSLRLRSPNQKSGSQYLQEVLGDILAQALSAVAKERPKDPVKYVADFLHNIGVKQHAFETKRDSGHFEDQEAPGSNQSSSTLSTVQLNEKDRYDEGYHYDRHNRNRNSSSSDSRTPRSLERTGNRSRSKRRRTADSEPLPSVVSMSSVTYGKDVFLDDNYRRSRSLTDNRKPYNKHDPRRTYSKRVPVAALPFYEYKVKRGLKLTPMKSTPPIEADFDHRNRGIEFDLNGKPKPKQLKPLSSESDKFDWQRHLKKNRKIIRDNKIIANMI